MDRKTILVVEDEVRLAELMVDYLVGAGFDARAVHHGDEVAARLAELAPDLVLLDLMLPGRDGLSICRDIRAAGDLPVIMVTARVEEIDRLVGLELGADDYICKPFSPREVVARVKAVLRRAAAGGSAAPDSALVLEDDKFLATLHGRRLDLTPVEFRLLNLLAASPGKVFSRTSLLDAAYTDYRIVSDRTIDSHIKNLRRKISAVDAEHEWIESVYGVGYRLSAPAAADA